MGTIYGNIADIAGPDEKLFDFVKYDDVDLEEYGL